MTAGSRPRARGWNPEVGRTRQGVRGCVETPDTIRFACGHREPHHSALARARQNARIAWIQCARCNVITVAGFAHRPR
jgi:hypothetical protein